MEVVIFSWLFSKNLTVQSGLNIGEQHWWPLAGNTPQVLWHMIHYKVSVAITVWKTVTKTQDIFLSHCRSYKHVDYSSKEVCTLCNRYLGVCYVLHHLSNCIPVGHGLYIQFTGPFPCL